MIGKVIATSTLLTALLLTSSSAQNTKPVRACLVSGSLEYDSNETMAILQKRLEKKGVVCSRAFQVGKDDTHLPGLENLDNCDVMVLFTRRLKLQGEELERFKKYCLAGKPIVGIRTASHAVQTWLDLDKEVFGGDYNNHFGKGTTHVRLVKKQSPLLAGVSEFDTEGTLYKNAMIAADCDVLLTGTNENATMPIAWTRSYKGGRIFYTSLGHQKDFENQNFLRLMENAVSWAAGR
jgi:type 1 glutamine amidotransferase